MRTLLLASTILLSAGSAVAQETPSNILTPERVFSSPSLNGPVAKGVSLSPDGQLVAFLRSREDNVDVQDLWAAPTGEGEPYKLIDARAATSLRRWRATSSWPAAPTARCAA
jgi:dipeptidyl-peptidase-4